MSGGVAGLLLFAPRVGDRATTAVYKGDGSMFGGISGVVTQKVVVTAAAAITSIADVKNDQGGQVRLIFGRNPFDYDGSGTPNTGCKLLRRQIVTGMSGVLGARVGPPPVMIVTATGDDFTGPSCPRWRTRTPPASTTPCSWRGL